MKKILSTLLLTFLLQGCFHQRIDDYDIKRAIAQCEGVDKIVLIQADFAGVEQVRCKGKAQSFLKEVHNDEK
jgi:hypothetical protein